MTAKATIHRLQSGDLEAFRALQRVYAEAFEDPASYLSKPPSDAYVLRWLASDAKFALVAKSEDGAVVAGLTAYVLDKPEQERSEIYIYDLAVLETHRRRGIATALIRELQAIGKSLGAWVIFVQADYGDDPAIALYESLGLREEVLHFDVPVG